MNIAIDIGGTNLKSAIVDDSANIVIRNTEPTNLSKDGFITQIINIIFNYLEQYPDIENLGIGIPGILDEEGTLIVSPNLTGLLGINLNDEINKHYNLNVFIENDANTAAIGELIKGVAKDLKSFIYITLGTGVGGAIIHNRKLFKGINGGAGEIGHIKICCKKNDGDFTSNTLESFVGRKSIINRFNELLRVDGQAIESNIDVDKINDLASSGNQYAIKTLEDTGYYLGLGIASVINLLDISNVVIGGGISNSNSIFYDSLQKTVLKNLMPNLTQQFQLFKSMFKSDSGIIGAAMLSKYFGDNGL